MELFILFIVITVAVMIFLPFLKNQERKEVLSSLSPEDQAIQKAKWASIDREANMRLAFGPKNPNMVCPHCATRGSVRTKQVKLKKGVSGGKATAALLTGGVSLLATGLSRKEAATQARCDSCGNSWLF